MSINTMKKKAVVLYGTKKSGRPTTTDGSNGVFWVNRIRGFSQSTPSISSAISFGTNGFSINGSTRNRGYIGKTYAVSKHGTRYSGIHPYGHGGSGGRYYQAEPVFNSGGMDITGNQRLFMKPTVQSHDTRLLKKYNCFTGSIGPTPTVKDIYTGNMSDNTSQGVYINGLSSSARCSLGANSTKVCSGDSGREKYAEYCVDGCVKRSVANKTFDNIARQGLYGKPSYTAIDSSTYMSYITKSSYDMPKPLVTQNGSNPRTVCADLVI